MGDTETPDGAPAGAVGVVAPPTGPILENSFVSSVGWVKPGDAYPFTLTVPNYGVDADPQLGRDAHGP